MLDLALGPVALALFLLGVLVVVTWTVVVELRLARRLTRTWRKWERRWYDDDG